METILLGDALEQLRTLPPQSVDTCITSPPYFGLRDYGVDGQLGLERSPEEYVQKLVEVFREVRRVLRLCGTLWLVIGDSYSGSGKGRNKNGAHYEGKPSKSSSYIGTSGGQLWKTDAAGCKPKDLMKLDEITEGQKQKANGELTAIHVEFTCVEAVELFDREDLDFPHYAIIKGIESNGTEAWSLTTDLNHGLNLSDWRELGAKNQLFYYTNYQTIYALKIETGELVWENEDIGRLICSDAGFSDCKVGENGELFLCAGSDDGFLVVDANGKTMRLFVASMEFYADAEVVGITYTDKEIDITTIGRDGTINEYVGNDERHYVVPRNQYSSIPVRQDGQPARMFVKNVDSNLNLRFLPQHESALAAKITDNSVMYFYGEVQKGYGSDGVLHDWYYVTTSQNVRGWARSDLVKEIFN